MTSHYLRVDRGDSLCAVCFVHGLGGDYRATWEDFPFLLAQDSDLTHCDIVCWGYPTDLRPSKWMNIKPFGRKMPDLETVSSTLYADLINSEIGGSYTDLILVGHSMGGLIIRSMIVQALTKTPPEYSVLSRIRHVYLYASPSKGVEISTLGKLHPQIRQLSYDHNFIEVLNKEWTERVLMMGERDLPVSGKKYIKTTAVVGSEDNVVNQNSASSLAHDIVQVQGNHVEVVKPKDRNQSTFQTLKVGILQCTLPKHINTHESLTLANIKIVNSASSYIFCIGSRSSDQCYLDAIENRLKENTNLKFYRALLGKPKREMMLDHIRRILEMKSNTPEKGQHARRLHISAFDDDSKQTEIAICGNEKCVLVVLPSRGGIGTYNTATIFTENNVVNDYFNFTKQLIEAGQNFKSAAELKHWYEN